MLYRLLYALVLRRIPPETAHGLAARGVSLAHRLGLLRVLGRPDPALAAGPLSLAGLLLLAGAAISPTIVYANSMLDRLAPAGTLTEAFTWTTAGMTAGVAAGAALAGAIVETASPSIAFAALGGCGLFAAALVRAAARGALRPAVAV